MPPVITQWPSQTMLSATSRLEHLKSALKHLEAAGLTDQVAEIQKAIELERKSEARRELKTQADYDALFETYERDSLPKQSTALEKIREWVATGQRVALTCFELLPEQCHRHCVADELARRWGQTLAPQHL